MRVVVIPGRPTRSICVTLPLLFVLLLLLLLPKSLSLSSSQAAASKTIARTAWMFRIGLLLFEWCSARTSAGPDAEHRATRIDECLVDLHDERQHALPGK